MYLGTATSIYVWAEKSQVGNHTDRTLIIFVWNLKIKH